MTLVQAEAPLDALSAKLRSALRDHFGYRDFRPDQERIIRLLLEGRDVLAVLPTGAGKSLVYQLAAQFLPGITIVVSPLIALMKDQVESVEEHGLAASAVNSAQSAGQRDDEIANLQRDAQLLYVTPERLENAEFRARLEGLSVSLLVVDEAHCISEWGSTFRPAYLTLPAAIDALGRPTLLALTATATPWVRRDIVQRLGLRDPAVVVQGVDRPNLFLEVLRVETEVEEGQVLRALLGSGEAGSVGGIRAPEPEDDLAALTGGSGI